MLRRSRSDEHKPDDGNASRVLVVDEDDDCRELVARLLEQATYDVERCDTHDDAVRRLRYDDPPYAGVVIDFQDGGTSSSLKLLDALRHLDDAKRAKTPALILTSADTNQVFAWQSGVDGFLVRPFHGDEFVGEVHAMLERTPEAREGHRRDMVKKAKTAQARRLEE